MNEVHYHEIVTIIRRHERGETDFLLLRYALIGERFEIGCLLGSGEGSSEMAVPKNEGHIERQKQSVSFRCEGFDHGFSFRDRRWVIRTAG